MKKKPTNNTRITSDKIVKLLKENSLPSLILTIFPERGYIEIELYGSEPVSYSLLYAFSKVFKTDMVDVSSSIEHGYYDEHNINTSVVVSDSPVIKEIYERETNNS